MDPLRKDEKFTDEKFEQKFKDEKRKPVDLSQGNVSQSGEFQPEEQAEAYAETESAERLSVPMGPIPVSAPSPKSEAKGGPRLITKESKAAAEAKKTCFFSESESEEMRARWDKIQGAFVDQPRQAVEDADNLLGEAIKKLTEQFNEERSTVIREWNSGDNVSTEVLRQAFRRYRTFFDRLLAA